MTNPIFATCQQPEDDSSQSLRDTTLPIQPQDHPWHDIVARNFADYRHPIPPDVVDVVYRNLGLRSSDPILDLGCGTGLLAQELILRSSNVTGIDVSQSMLREAERTLAGHPGREHITLTDTPLERLAAAGTRFKAALICRAFFAMPREQYLQHLESMVEPGGAVVLIDDPNFYRNQEPWQGVVRQIINAHFESRELPPLERSHQDVIRASTFSNLTEQTIEVSRPWDLERVLGILYSTGLGAVAAQTPAAARQEFERKLSAALLDMFPTGTWTERAAFELIIARRPGEL
jgi:2-polyprenyl-3-methyl-5-hydroxy-6-metoxy-1,4-benzoquinol methylase